ncbi:MAG: hypothetical protein AVDCRST_MAG18-1824, partial [uncultured Thermomicrobiales bacterium]
GEETEGAQRQRCREGPFPARYRAGEFRATAGHRAVRDDGQHPRPHRRARLACGRDEHEPHEDAVRNRDVCPRAARSPGDCRGQSLALRGV